MKKPPLFSLPAVFPLNSFRSVSSDNDKSASGRQSGLVKKLAACLAIAAAGAASPAQTFTDVTAAAGLVYEQRSAIDCDDYASCEVPFMTGGAATADYDGDGWPDLLVTRLGAPDILYRNRGDGTFEDVTAGSGLDEFSFLSNGAAWADIDNDGDPDLYVTVAGGTRFYLFINDGAGHFTEEAVARGAAVETQQPHSGFSVAVGDYDRDGWLDLFTTEWAVKGNIPSHSRLLRNRGEAAPGFFDDVTIEAGVSLDAKGFFSQATRAFAPAFVDLDQDGWPDLAIAADFGTSKLFWNNGDGTFTDGTAAAGVGSDENGMGSTFGDYDADGDLDWFVTSIFDPEKTCLPAAVQCNWGNTGNRLYRNDGGRLFSDQTDAAGVRDGAWGWGTVFFDADNDGDLDLVMTNGMDMPDEMLMPPELDAAWERDRMRFWRNDGTGVMSEEGAEVGLDGDGNGKGLLAFDYDRDGDLDILVVNNPAGAVLYRNDRGNRRGWLRVRLRGTLSNRDGLGAKIRVQSTAGGRWQIRQVGVGSHYLGQSENTAHFGLGSLRVPVYRVEVVWPSGRRSRALCVSRNSTIEMVEPDGDDEPRLQRLTRLWGRTRMGAGAYRCR